MVAASAALAVATSLLATPARAGEADVELEDGGQWRRQASELDGTDLMLRAVSCADEQHCTAVGAFGVIVATDDGGASWHTERPPTGRGTGSRDVQTLMDVSCPNPTLCVAVGEGGLLMTTHDGGDSWAQRNSGVALPLNAVSCMDTNPPYCVALGGSSAGHLPPHGQAVLTSEDGGKNWVRHPGTGQASAPSTGAGELGLPHLDVACAEPLDEVGGPAPSDLAHCQAVGYDPTRVFVTYGRIFGSKTGGRTWTPETDRMADNVPRSVSCADIRVCYAVTGGDSDQAHAAVPMVLKTLDGGASWAPVDTALEDFTPGEGLPDQEYSELHGISCADVDHCVAVGGDIGGFARDLEPLVTPSVILATDDGGDNWAQVDPGTRAPLQDVSCPSPQVCVAVGHAGTILATDDGGASWARQHLGNLADLAVTDARHGYAVGAGGLIVATADRGASWARQDAGTTADLKAVTFVNADGCPPAQPACYGWAVGHAGTILATTDGGDTWTSQPAASDADAATEADLTDIACLEAETCWATGRTPRHADSPPTIVATTDGGQTWSAQQTSDDLFAIACPGPSTCYAAGGPAGASPNKSAPLVLATTDGGATWTEQNLPTTVDPVGVPEQNRLYSLACPTVDRCLAGGSQTNADGDRAGMVFGTDNGGDTWTRHSLPAVDKSAGPVVTGLACVDTTRCHAVTGSGASLLKSLTGKDYGAAATRHGVVWATDPSDEFGATWIEQDRMAHYELSSVALDPTSASPTAWAVGAGGTILSTVDLIPGPVELSARQVDPTTVQLSWPAAGLDGVSGNGPAQRYQVRQASEPITAATFNAEGVRRLCDAGDCFSGELTDIGDPVRFTVSDLGTGRTYHWAARAVDEAGQTGPMATASLTVPEVPPAAVDDLTATAVSNSEIRLTFSAVGSDGDAGAPADEYVVKQARTSIDDDADFAAATALCGEVCTFGPSQTGEELSLTVGDLQAASTYHYAVKARDDAGELSGLSNPASAATLPAGGTGGGGTGGGDSGGGDSGGGNGTGGDGSGDGGSGGGDSEGSGSGDGATGEGGAGEGGTRDGGDAPTGPASTHACPEGQVPDAGFADVDAGNVHAPAIDCMAWYVVSHGTSATTYTPAGVTTRAQMASFIARTMETAGADLGDPGDQGFTDIASNPHAERINQLAAAGVVQGTTEATYIPQAPVTRAQMASFLVRAYQQVTDTALPAGESGFTDTRGSVHEANIDKAFEAGWAFGVSRDSFNPNAGVRRDQQASFLARMLDTLVGDGFAAPPDNNAN